MSYLQALGFLLALLDQRYHLHLGHQRRPEYLVDLKDLLYLLLPVALGRLEHQVFPLHQQALVVLVWE